MLGADVSAVLLPLYLSTSPSLPPPRLLICMCVCCIRRGTHRSKSEENEKFEEICVFDPCMGCQTIRKECCTDACEIKCIACGCMRARSLNCALYFKHIDEVDNVLFFYFGSGCARDYFIFRTFFLF